MNYLVPIIAVFGFYNISSKINNKLNLKVENLYFSIISFLTILGLLVIALSFRINLAIFFNLLLIIFFISFINFLFSNYKIIKSFLFKERILSIFLIFFSILTLIPIAGADSYAYHLAWPQDLIKNPKVFFDELFLESRVVGIGEIVNYIGLSLKTENLLSFLSFVTLFAYVLKIKKDKKNLIILVLLASPIYYKYLLDQKPFILPCLFLIIFLDYFFKKIFSGKTNYLDIYAFFLSLSFFANTKYPFLVIAFFIYVFFLYFSVKEKFFFKYIFLSLLILIFHFLPLPLMKFIVFGDPFPPFLEGIINKGDEDILMLKEMYKSWDGFKISTTLNGYEGLIPIFRNVLNFFIPIAPFTVLDTFGASVLFILLVRFNSKIKLIFSLLTFILILFLVLLTNFQSRWFLFIFLYVVLSFDYLSLSSKNIKFLNKLFLLVACVILVFHVFYLGSIVYYSLKFGFQNTKQKYVYLYKEIFEVKKVSGESFVLTNARGNYFYDNLIQYKYKKLSKKYLKKNKNVEKIKYGFFSTGTDKISDTELFSKSILTNFQPDCIEILYNNLNLVAKRNIFSRKDYENFIFVKFKKPILKCLN